MPGLPLLDPVDDEDTMFFGPGAFDGDVLAELDGETVEGDPVHDQDHIPIPIAGN
jgi:hypothetical protein